MRLLNEIPYLLYYVIYNFSQKSSYNTNSLIDIKQSLKRWVFYIYNTFLKIWYLSWPSKRLPYFLVKNTVVRLQLGSSGNIGLHVNQPYILVTILDSTRKTIWELLSRFCSLDTTDTRRNNTLVLLTPTICKSVFSKRRKSRCPSSKETQEWVTSLCFVWTDDLLKYINMGPLDFICPSSRKHMFMGKIFDVTF